MRVITRVGAVVVLVVLGALTWWSRRPAPLGDTPPAPRRVPAPEAPFEVFGQVLDRTGAPAEGAEVALFPDPGTWLPRFSVVGPRSSDDEGRDCVRWPLACESDTARAEVLRQLDAGTLAFPQPLVKTRTDADGHFSLQTPTRDAFVVARRGFELDISAAALSPWQSQSLAFDKTAEEAVELTPETTSLLVINPYTRQAKRFDAGAGIDVPAEGSLIWLDQPGAHRQRVSVELWYDGGLVDGVVKLGCGHEASPTLHTDGGVATAELVLRPEQYCELAAEAPALFAKTQALMDVVTLQRRTSLTVRWAPVGAFGPAGVVVDFPCEPHTIGCVGIGGRRPGYGLFDGGVAVFDPLYLDEGPQMMEVTVQQPGFFVQTAKLEVKPGMNELSVALERAPGSVGFVVDSAGRAVPEVVVDALRPDGGYGNRRSTDARGAFSLRTIPGEFPRLEARHPLVGAASAVGDSLEPVMLSLQPTSDVTLTFEDVDGGVFAQRVVRLKTLGEGFDVKTNPRGEVLVPGLAPGQADLVVETGADQPDVRIEVPVSGAVRKTVRMR